MSLTDSERLWWSRPDGRRDDEDPTAHEKIKAVIKSLASREQRKRAMLLYGAMYAGASMGLGGYQADSLARATPSAMAALSLNVSRSVVDAVTSRVFSKSKPHLTYATEGGGPEKQHNAELLDRGVDGVFYQSNYYRKATRAGRDGCVYGTGILRIEPGLDTGKVSVLRWRPWELLVEDAETALDEVRSHYAQHYEDRARLVAMVRAGHWADGDLETKAYLCDRLETTENDDADGGDDRICRRVLKYEAWRLPSMPGGGDGRYVLGVENTTLIDRPWDGLHLPFARYSWSDPLEGWYGQGLVELGFGIQSEINKLVREIQEGHHFITGYWLAESNSKVVAAHINNDLRRIIRYAGTQPPTYVTPSIISPEVYQHLWNLVARYYELAGVNQQSAQAQKPAGLDSGEAQRVYADQQTETLLDKGARYEDFVRECGALVTSSAKELSGSGVYEVRALRADGYEVIDWAKLDDPDGYELQVAPTSSLPGTPSGKIAFAQDLLKLGDLDASDLMEIVGMPDMLSATHLKLASRRLVKKRVGEMLRDGTPWAPHPILNLKEAVAVARDMHNDAEFRDVADDRLQLVRDFIDECTQLDKTATPPPQPAMAPAGGALMAPGVPGASPPMPHAPPMGAAA